MTDTRAIEAGDMVIFMRSCCSSGNPYLGAVFQVERVQGKFPHVWCDGCEAKHTGMFARFKLSAASEYTAWIPLKWLKRIPPLDELEGKRTQENLRQPITGGPVGDVPYWPNKETA